MTSRILCAVALFLFTPPAAAQWQPLDGGSGGNPGPGATPPAAASPYAPATPAMPTAPDSGIQGWTSTPSYGTPATPPAVSPPAPGGTPSIAGPGPAVPPPGVPTVEITYSGQAAADPRTASMKLILAGNQASAHVTMSSICAQNIHVGGADIDLTGGLSGAWESASGSIDGTWTGIDHHCGSDDPNQGQFKFFFKDVGMGQKVLHLRVTGKNGTYGWNFKPTGKTYTTTAPAATPGFVAAGNGFSSAVGRPGAGYRSGAGTPAYAASGTAPNFADALRQNFLGGVITLQVGDSHLQSYPSRSAARVAMDSSGRIFTTSDECVNSGANTLFMDPSSIADAVEIGSSVKLTGRAKGQGELWISGSATCKGADGNSYPSRTVLVYIVLVGNAAIDDFRRQQGGGGTPPPATPPGDIGQAGLSGMVRMVGDGQPVAGAAITLGTPEGGAISDPSWITDANGRFSLAIGADRNLRTGRYEVIAQKLRQGPVPGQCEPLPGTPAGIGNDCDLWSVRRYFVDFSRDRPSPAVGAIDMDFVRNIDFPSRKGAFEAAPASRRFR